MSVTCVICERERLVWFREEGRRHVCVRSDIQIFVSRMKRLAMKRRQHVCEETDINVIATGSSRSGAVHAGSWVSALSAS
eukprot:355723-Rhodomonas_salina.4